MLIEICCRCEHGDELARGNAAQGVAGLLGLAHVALDDAATGLANFGNWLAGGEMIDVCHLERLVRLAPTDDGKFQHGDLSLSFSRLMITVGIDPVQYTPTVVASAKRRNGRVPLMPSQGNSSQGGSRSPSSRSKKPGMKNSLVSVVSFARPVSP